MKAYYITKGSGNGVVVNVFLGGGSCHGCICLDCFGEHCGTIHA